MKQLSSFLIRSHYTNQSHQKGENATLKHHQAIYKVDWQEFQEAAVQEYILLSLWVHGMKYPKGHCQPTSVNQIEKSQV
jgi:hypothetical protein